MLQSEQEPTFSLCQGRPCEQPATDIHAQDNAASTVLIWNAYGGHLDCLKYLHEQGADIDAKNNNGGISFDMECQGRPFSLCQVSMRTRS